MRNVHWKQKNETRKEKLRKNICNVELKAENYKPLVKST